MKKKIDTEKVDGFFYSASKKLIYVPIVIFVLSLLIRAIPASTGTVNQPMRPAITPTTPLQAAKIAIDLKGPYICIYKEGKTEVEAYIKNKRVLVNVKEGNIKSTYRLDGDCAYIKEQKICNIGTYVLMFEGLLGNNISGLEGMVGKYTKTNIDLNAAIKSCKKEDFKDSVFEK